MNPESDGDAFLGFTQPANLEQPAKNLDQHHDDKCYLHSQKQFSVANAIFVVVRMFRVPFHVHVRDIAGDGDISRLVVLKAYTSIGQLLKVGVISDALYHHMPREFVQEKPLPQKLQEKCGLLAARGNIKVRHEAVRHANQLAVREGIWRARFFDLAAVLGSVIELRDDVHEVTVEHRRSLILGAGHGLAEERIHTEGHLRI
mmetsp:Transcript_20190/g.32711  ORF Transcript_20190/g.32711 Transcript_20190/m.32711 type:complete len:202 (+) Transcript_20190:215-820(+)